MGYLFRADRAFHFTSLMSSSLSRPSVRSCKIATTARRPVRNGSNTLVAKAVFVPAHRMRSLTKDPKCRAVEAESGYASCWKFPGYKDSGLRRIPCWLAHNDFVKVKDVSHFQGHSLG